MSVKCDLNTNLPNDLSKNGQSCCSQRYSFHQQEDGFIQKGIHLGKVHKIWQLENYVADQVDHDGNVQERFQVFNHYHKQMGKGPIDDYSKIRIFQGSYLYLLYFCVPNDERKQDCICDWLKEFRSEYTGKCQCSGCPSWPISIIYILGHIFCSCWDFLPDAPPYVLVSYVMKKKRKESKNWGFYLGL